MTDAISISPVRPTHARRPRATRRAALIVTALALSGSIARAQAPAIQQYDSHLDDSWISWGGEGFGPGFFFTTAQSGLSISALSYFNPDVSGGASGFPSWSLAGGGIGVYLYAFPRALQSAEYFDLSAGTSALASVIVNNASAARVVTSGAPGAFFTVVLATPVALLPNTVYGVFGGTLVNGSVGARMTETHSYVPTMDPRITYLDPGTRWAPSGTTWMEFHDENIRQFTGASFELAQVTATPEPATFALAGIGLVGLGALQLRRRRTQG